MGIAQIEALKHPIPLKHAIWHGLNYLKWRGIEKRMKFRKQIEYWIRKCYPPRFWIQQNGRRWARNHPKEAKSWSQMKNIEKWLDREFAERIG